MKIRVGVDFKKRINQPNKKRPTKDQQVKQNEKKPQTTKNTTAKRNPKAKQTNNPKNLGIIIWEFGDFCVLGLNTPYFVSEEWEVEDWLRYVWRAGGRCAISGFAPTVGTHVHGKLFHFLEAQQNLTSNFSATFHTLKKKFLQRSKYC